MQRITFILFVIIIGFSACSSSKTSRKPVTNIQITPSNKMVSFGNEITVDIQSRFTKPKIESIELYLNNKLIEKSNQSNFSLKINTKDYLPGNYTIKTIATNTDGKQGTNYVRISVVSNLKPRQLGYKLHESFPHNTKNYTEGFEFYKGKIYEGTGNNNESFIYTYRPGNKSFDSSVKLNKQFFGEGITVLNNKLYQLTYKAQKGFIYDPITLKKTGEFNFKSKEGWGLTNDGKYLIMSNGTSSIIYIDPDSFKEVKRIEVSTPKGFVSNINELEYVNGVIYANIWTTQTIVKFEAETGRVLAFINMNGLLTNLQNNKVDVFNGIAYQPDEKMFYVTGKWWPNIYKVTFQ